MPGGATILPALSGRFGTDGSPARGGAVESFAWPGAEAGALGAAWSFVALWPQPDEISAVPASTLQQILVQVVFIVLAPKRHSGFDKFDAVSRDWSPRKRGSSLNRSFRLAASLVSSSAV